MNYNMTLYTEAENFFDKLIVIDSFANNILFPGFIIGLFIIVLVVSSRFSPPAESFFGAALTAAVIAVGLTATGAVSLFWAVGFTLLSAFAGAGLYVTNKT